MNRWKTVALIFILVLSPQTATMMGWQWSSMEVIANNDEHANYPSMAIDDGGNIHAVWTSVNDDFDIFYSMWISKFQTWSSALVVSTESTGASLAPAVAVDIGGNVHVVWTDTTDYLGSGTDQDLFYKKYNTNTDTWGTTEIIFDARTGVAGTAEIASDRWGNVYITWADTSDYNGAGTDTDVFLQKWVYETQSWDDILVVSSERTGSSYNQKMSIDQLGNVHIVWKDVSDILGASTDDDVFYKFYDARSQALSGVQLVSDESTGLVEGVDIEADINNNLHVVWNDYTDIYSAGTDSDIFYREYSFEDQRWGPLDIISTEISGTSLDPTITSNSLGDVIVCWQENSNYLGAGTDWDIFAKTKKNTEAYWGIATSVLTTNDGHSTGPKLLVDQSDFVHLIFEDGSDYDSSGTDTDIFHMWYGGYPDSPILNEISIEIQHQLVDLTWSSSYAASTYHVYREDSPIHEIKDLSPIIETKNTYYVDEPDEEGVYYYAIAAVNQAGYALSNNIIVVIGNLPGSDKTNAIDSIIEHEATIPAAIGSIIVIIIAVVVIKKR
ncbi:MAG: hypothetical protein INQ03_20445 [Candidatus Heimdallarchaeota archaeon]|nr:hypothetical protein [Candidatus Heimdallarchaeota archaeon]